MSQFARPSQDTTRVNWEEDDGTTVTIYDQINGSTPDDLTYIRTGLAPAGSAYVAKLSPVVDPVSSASHVVAYRFRKDATGGDVVNLQVQLRQGYVSEGTLGTLIASKTETDITGVDWADGTFTLSGAEADSITDYTALFLRFVATTG
jgi:hypothetical protein